MDIEPIINGLQVSGIGMGMTSAVLIILAVSVRAVSWADVQLRRRETERQAQEEESVDDGPEIPAVEPVDVALDGRARAAAIAVALALSQRENDEPALQTSMPRPADAPSDTWLTEGRARQHASREPGNRTRDWR